MVEENASSKDKRICCKCDSKTTHIDKKKQKSGTITIYEAWYKDKNGGWLCKKCYSRYIGSPKNNISRAAKRITYKKKRIYAKKKPRIGICNLCRAVIPFDCKRTHMHHEEYDDSDPEKHTIEICARCHSYLHEGIESDRVCYLCESHTTRTEHGRYPKWHKAGNIYICASCYDTTVNKIRRRKNNL